MIRIINFKFDTEIKFAKNKVSSSRPEKEFEPSFKKASGGDSVPSSDDPGFGS